MFAGISNSGWQCTQQSYEKKADMVGRRMSNCLRMGSTVHVLTCSEGSRVWLKIAIDMSHCGPDSRITVVGLECGGALRPAKFSNGCRRFLRRVVYLDGEKEVSTLYTS